MTNDIEDCIDSGDQSLNSSYADVYGASGVVIRDCEGSFTRGPALTNIITYSLNKCKKQVVNPYYKLLCLIAWRPFGREYARSAVARWCLSLLNFVYTLLCFLSLFFWYYIRVRTCQGRLVIDAPRVKPTAVPTPRPTHHTIPPNVTTWNWTRLYPALIDDANASTIVPSESYLDPCQHIFGSYLVPNFLHFLAFAIGFYHFRISDNEGLYALMEKVYLQSHCPQKMTRALRLVLYSGIVWLLLDLGTTIHYIFAFNVFPTEGLPRAHQATHYVLLVLIVIASTIANSVNVVIVISWAGQCQLLKYYIDDVKERLEEKSIELKAAMKDILDIKRNFNRLNGILSLSLSCIVFNLLITFIICIVLLISDHDEYPLVWSYRFAVAAELGAMLGFILVQACTLTSKPKVLLQKALAIRVYGYQAHTQLDIDSFLNFLSLVTLEVQIFTIPVKPRYVLGVLILSIQILILAFQTGSIIGHNRWF